MKHTLRTLTLSVLGIITFIALSGVALAAAEKTQAKLDAGQTHTGLYARAADTVTINGVVNGDVWVAGEKVVVDGVVNGNVYAAGSDVTVKGQVTGSVHAAGSEVVMGGTIAGSVYAAGSEVQVGDGTKVTGAAALAGSQVDLGGAIAQQAYLAGSTIDISGQIGQYARITGSDISLSDTASIAGDLTYESSEEARIANDRAIGGRVEHKTVQKAEPNPMRDKIVGAVIGLILNLIIGFIIVVWMPRIVRSTDAQFRADPLSTTLKGIAFMFFAPIVLVLTFITLLGIPVAVLGGLFYIMLAIVAPALVSYSLGGYILQRFAQKAPTKKTSRLKPLLIGSVAFTIVSLIPFVGGLFEFILAAAGMGMVIARGLKPLQEQA